MPRALFCAASPLDSRVTRNRDPRDDPTARGRHVSTIKEESRETALPLPRETRNRDTGRDGTSSAALPEDRGFYPARTKVRKCPGNGETAKRRKPSATAVALRAARSSVSDRVARRDPRKKRPRRASTLCQLYR